MVRCWSCVVLWLPAVSAAVPIVGWKMPVNLTYEEQVAAFAIQGITNQAGPRLFFDTGPKDFDWSQADAYWIQLLASEGRADVTWAAPTLCGLVGALDSVNGTLLYETAETEFGDGYTYALALTLAGVDRVVPVSTAVARAHPCLRALPVAYDWTVAAPFASREDAYAFALTELLPRTSKTTFYNLNKYRVATDPEAWRTDPQSNATLTSADYAVQQRAMVVDLETHLASQPLRPVVDPDLLPDWDDAMLYDFLTADGEDGASPHLSPLFGAFGWSSDETSWTNHTSRAGGVVYCSFASPDLSFWAAFPLPEGVGAPRPLPTNDRGAPLNRSKSYVTFMTNEGDTPRILDSVFSSSWASSDRGSLPVAWSVDAALAERFPALWDHFAASASANDSFVGGVSGAGYVYVDQLSEAQLDRYAAHYGRLAATYNGPSVVDVYGQADLGLMRRYAERAAATGRAPDAFVSQPTTNMGFSEAFNCTPANQWLGDGTPVVCSVPGLFYYNAHFWPKDQWLKSADDLAGRIRREVAALPAPAFVLAYGGLKWTSDATDPQMDFFTLQKATLDVLGDDFVVVGAQEMARLSREAAGRP